MNKKKKCFVIMPVSDTTACTEAEWAGIFEYMIKPAVTGSGLGFDCKRAEPRSGAFIRDILEGLNSAEVVIADLTNRNPNVCYELGIRHTLRNRTILIAQNIDDVPSDLQSYWVVTYKKDLTGASEFKRKIREIFREMQKDPEKPDSPVSDFLQIKNIDILAYEKANNLKKLDALLSELSFNIDGIDKIAQDLNKYSNASSRFKSGCIKLFLSTRYINPTSLILDRSSLYEDVVDWLNLKLSFFEYSGRNKELARSLGSMITTWKQSFESLFKMFAKIRNAYASDNYQEPKEPIIKLASPDHNKLLEQILPPSQQ